MAHELDFAANGEAAMAYVGETPWHSLGQELERGMPIEEWQRAAHMDWEIQRAAVQFNIPKVEPLKTENGRPLLEIVESNLFPEKHVLYRSDNHRPLSVVSDKYKIVQPKEVLEFYRDLVGSVGMELETAGVLFGGKRFWALANTGRAVELKGQTVDGIYIPDTINGYLLLSTSCDGTLATTARFTSIRVVCNNTLSIATKDNKTVVRVPHNRTWNEKEVKEQLGFIDKGWNKFRTDIEKLANATLDRDTAIEYLVRLLGDPEVPLDQQSPAVSNKCSNVWELYTNSGKGAHMGSAENTFWGMVNAITQTVDYHTGHRTQDARLNGAWFGTGNNLKTQAFELALDMVTA